MFRKKDHIFIRMLEFGVNQPDGFTHQEFENWQIKSNLTKDEKKLCGHSFSEVFKNTLENGKNVMFVESFFNYIDYVELKEARRNSKQAFWMSIGAICISAFSLYFSICGDIKLEKDTTINLSKSSIESIVNGINK